MKVGSFVVFLFLLSACTRSSKQIQDTKTSKKVGPILLDENNNNNGSYGAIDAQGAAHGICAVLTVAHLRLDANCSPPDATNGDFWNKSYLNQITIDMSTPSDGALDFGGGEENSPVQNALRKCDPSFECHMVTGCEEANQIIGGGGVCDIQLDGDHMESIQSTNLVDDGDKCRVSADDTGYQGVPPRTYTDIPVSAGTDIWLVTPGSNPVYDPDGNDPNFHDFWNSQGYTKAGIECCKRKKAKCDTNDPENPPDPDCYGCPYQEDPYYNAGFEILQCEYNWGCTNKKAKNYDPKADHDNGSCVILGCTEIWADNYDPEATQDDGSCFKKGCLLSAHPRAINPDPEATLDDGSCIVQGCMNPHAINFDPDANQEIPNSCVIQGCTDPTASNFDQEANQNVGCLYPGCMNPIAINYQARNNVDDGSCIILGCTIPGYDSYNILANQNDGFCSCAENRIYFNNVCTGISYGCRDKRYDNYSASANTDSPCECDAGRYFDGHLCKAYVTGCRDSTYDNYLAIADQDGECLCNTGRHYNNGACVPDGDSGGWAGIHQISGAVPNINSRAITHDSQNNLIAGGFTNNKFDNNEVLPVAGEEALPDGQSAYIIKYDTSGAKKWIKRFGPPKWNYSTVEDLLTDSAGNIYSVGHTTGSLGVGYIRKFDKDGHTLWNTNIGGLTGQSTWAMGVAFDSDGNLVVGGYTTENFGEGGSGQKFLLFIASFNASSGARGWIHTLGGGAATSSSALRVVRGSSGDLYFSGYTTGNIGGKLSPSGMYDCVIGRYSKDGVKKWIKQYGEGSGTTVCEDIAMDSNGAIYVDGFTSAVLYEEDLQNRPQSTSDGFVAKFTETMNDDETVTVQSAWTRQFGGSESATATTARGLALDSNGNVVVVGQASGSLFGNQLMGLKDLFVAKFNSSGARMWSKQVGSAQSTVLPEDVDIDSTGGIFLTGSSDASANANACPSVGSFVMKFLLNGDQQ